MKVKALGMIAGALFAVAPLVAVAAGLPAPFEGSSTLQAEGIVKSVDQGKHSVTVLDGQGSEASFNVTETANLSQIQRGAKVQIRMMRNAVVTVTRAAGAHATSAQAARPSNAQNVTAEVETIDHATGIMGLKAANGSAFHLQGREPARLANVTPGMEVQIVYSPQVAVAVAPVQ